MLRVDALKVAYGRVMALHGVSITVEQGELVTVIGANGAGKSTLLRAICGALRPAGGSITLDGSEVGGSSSSTMVQRGVAMIPEGRHIFPDMTVLENLELGAYYRRDAAGVRQDIEAAFNHFPILRERRATQGGTLSGGQQQMLAIARALMSKPRLLLLDEPSLGLAPAIILDVVAIVRDLNRAGTTILLVEQNARMALRIAHRAYVMATGVIVQAGTGADLLNDPAVQASYLGGHRA